MYRRQEIIDSIGITYVTLLRWERIGLLPKPRRLSNQRYYSQEELDNIKAKIADIKKNPDNYKYLNIRLKKTNGLQVKKKLLDKRIK